MSVDGVLLGFKSSEEFVQAASVLEECGIALTRVDTFESAAFPYLSKDLGTVDTDLVFLYNDHAITGLENIRLFATEAGQSE